MSQHVTLQVIAAQQLPASVRSEIQLLCNSAYGEDLSYLFAAYTVDWYILAHLDNRLVGNAMIVTRWLQAGHGPLLRTAYVEMMATAPGYQGRGIGSSVMQRLAKVAADGGYDLAALCPADTGIYNRLGWEYWIGPLFIRRSICPGKETPALIPTPEEQVMVLRLPETPTLDLRQSLSAEWREGGELW